MNDENLEIKETIDGDLCRFIASGRVDSNNAGIMETNLDRVLSEGQKNIILNMESVKYLSSIGIRIILKTYKKAYETGGTFQIENPSEIVKNVLGMVALNQMLLK